MSPAANLPDGLLHGELAPALDNNTLSLRTLSLARCPVGGALLPATGLLQEMSYTLFRHTAFYTGKSRLATFLDRDMLVRRLVNKCM